MAGPWRIAALAVLLLIGHAAMGSAGAADALPAPWGDVVLTVNGAIAARNDGRSATFDMAMLEALPRVEVATETPWTDGTTLFTGFRLADLLALLQADGSTLEAHALNDYETRIPIEDAARYGVIVAYRMNGEPMSPSGKGPLWIVYPYSDVPDLQSEIYYSRALWNLDRLTVE